MKTVTQHLRNTIYNKCGIVISKVEGWTMNEIKQNSWSKNFEQLMRNRLVVGCIRYGKIHDTEKPFYDWTREIIERVKLYEQTGNVNYLADIANFALLEYEEGYHSNKHLAVADDDKHIEKTI